MVCDDEGAAGCGDAGATGCGSTPKYLGGRPNLVINLSMGDECNVFTLHDIPCRKKPSNKVPNEPLRKGVGCFFLGIARLWGGGRKNISCTCWLLLAWENHMNGSQGHLKGNRT